jgi:predicted nucleotidyltransferase
MRLPPDFRELLEALVREKVEFAIVGGYAFAFHARPRATKDLDLLVAGDAENLARASRALDAFGAPENVVAAMATLGESEVVYMGRPPLRVDFLRAVDGVDAEQILRNAVRTAWEGVPVRVIALDDLIANKRAAARPQDVADVAVLEIVRSRGKGGA